MADPKPPAISDAAKLALALTMVAIAERIAQAAADAPDDMDGTTAADSMSDPAGVGVSDAFSNLFEGTHSTNIASTATAALRDKLADPAFRAKYPYVMIVVTNPQARASHRVMDGFIIPSEEARFSPYLPPFDFGCDCKAVPISADEARAAGLTGSNPTGDLESFLRGKGATPYGGGANSTQNPGWIGPDGRTFMPGVAAGFQPAYRGTDTGVQVSALRQKANALRSEDPEAFTALRAWLLWLFLGKDILTEDPEPEESTPDVEVQPADQDETDLAGPADEARDDHGRWTSSGSTPPTPDQSGRMTNAEINRHAEKIEAAMKKIMDRYQFRHSSGVSVYQQMTEDAAAGNADAKRYLELQDQVGALREEAKARGFDNGFGTGHLPLPTHERKFHGKRIKD